jgi:phosphoglycerate dehydrogenase-like enzyme
LQKGFSAMSEPARSSLPTVLVLGDRPRPRLDALDGRARLVFADETSLAGLLPGADVLLVWDFTSTAVRGAWPGDGPRPGWVHTASAGVDHLLSPELVASDTRVTNARGVFDQTIAEYVAALVLSAAKDLPGTRALQERREWRHRETERVAGKRACVVGSGPIGRAIARLLEAIGLRTSLVGRTARDGVHGQDELDGLLPEADWVVSVAPLTDATRGMFDARRFALMRPTARFVNVGRGPLVVEDDLVGALAEGRLAGAVLDVFEQEPLPADSPLWTAPGLLVSPHMSGDTAGWRDDLADQFLDQYDRWAAGEPLANVVDKARGYVPGA